MGYESKEISPEPVSFELPKGEEAGEERGPTLALRPPRERVVNTGFAPLTQADRPLYKTLPLASGQPYYFWLDIDKLDPQSIETTPAPFPAELLPSEAKLRVALFAFADEIRIIPGEDVGELQLRPEGTAKVLRQPSSTLPLVPGSDLLENRLFFPVEAPKKDGTFRLRCNIYHEQILVQSRMIRVRVMDRPQPAEGALSSALEYSLSHRISPSHLGRLPAYRLSMMFNRSGNDTHALLFGEKDRELFKNEAVLPAPELKKPIENARKALRKVSWGDPNPWTGAPAQQYRYQVPQMDPNRLGGDLISLAIGGYILYDGIIDKLSGGRKKALELAGHMRKPGLVQIALKQSPSNVVPAALFYDYPLDTQADDHKLCDAFLAALRDATPLENTPCFQGDCPRYDKLDYVCPSGFWGYRHGLGVPVSVAPGTDVPPEIVLRGEPQITVGVATNLAQVHEHMQELQKLFPGPGWNYSDNRGKILQLLKTKKSHLVYFYCHGGTANDTPYLQVGGGGGFIEGSNLRALHISWDTPQPLVFINGCHTTALDPEQAINLVQDFVNTGSAGVIGTEITIFEPLARSFAEDCLRRFLTDDVSIGEAVRRARLKLLKEGNPLGLIYTPFVLPSLHLVKQPVNP